MRLSSLWVLLCLALLVAVPSVASAKPNVVLTLSGVTVHKTASGVEKDVPLDPNVRLKTGEIVRWTIVAANKGSDPALHLTPSDKVPAGTVYVVASASTLGGHAEFSLDEGKTWTAKPMVTVQTTTGPVTKPADPSSYTTIRWIADKPLAPKGSLRFTYEVRVK